MRYDTIFNKVNIWSSCWNLLARSKWTIATYQSTANVTLLA